jgi:two-component system sensor histidine kinase RegB
MIPISEEGLKFRWLAGARWLTILGLFLAFLVGHWVLGFTFDVEPFINILLIFVASNIALYIPTIPPSNRLISITIIADVILLTVFLYFYGGSTNPLSSIYFLYVILASILLPPISGWITATSSSLCFGSLFFLFVPIPELTDGHNHHQHGFSTHLQGMLITFSFTAFVIVYFVTRLSAGLRTRESTLEALREKNRHSERLAGLTTLAAGAAHELRNPLATISISIDELARELEQSPLHQDMIVEARSVQSAVGRCQRIIDELCRNAGVVGGEPITTTSINQIIDQVLEYLPAPELCEVKMDQSTDGTPVKMFTSSLVQALLSLVQNGLEYGNVTLEVSRAADMIRFVVRDNGPGIPHEILPRLGEPFFTTKGAGRGMGLGIFITKTFADRLGGSLSFASELNKGTTATLCVPDLS